MIYVTVMVVIYVRVMVVIYVRDMIDDICYENQGSDLSIVDTISGVAGLHIVGI